MLFVGDDWAEDHHDVYLMDDTGGRLASRRLPEGLAGVRVLHELIAERAEDPAQVVIGIETDRGLWVDALTAADYQVFAVNPLAAARYRDRHHVSGAKSDASDAKLLADLVRTDRHNHRRIAGDSPDAEAIKVLARAHQNLIWARTRHTNALRSALREYYPAALEAFEDLADRDALAILGRAPTPADAGRLIEFWRDIPLLVNLLFIYFGAPLIGVPLKPFTAALLSLTLWGGANGAEIVRGGINAIGRHQFVSATALGLKRWEIYRYVVLPQALMPILPPMTGLCTTLVQATSLASLVGVNEFFRITQIVVERTTMQSGHSPAFLVYGFALMVYFAVCSALTRLSRYFEQHLQKTGTSAIAAPRGFKEST